MLSVCSFVLFLKFCMDKARVTGPGKVLDRNPADTERSSTAALGGISPSRASSPLLPLFFALSSQKILLIKHWDRNNYF